MILRIMIAFISIYVCSGHTGYNQTTPKAKIHHTMSLERESLILDKKQSVKCLNLDKSLFSTDTRFELLTIVNKNGIKIPYESREWIDAEIFKIPFITLKKTALDQLDILIDTKTIKDTKDMPFNVLYVRCKVTNKLGTSTSNSISFYMDERNYIKVKSCNKVTKINAQLYTGESFYYGCKSGDCDLTEVKDVVWYLHNKDVSKDMTLRYIFNNNVMFTKTGYTLILDKGAFYYHRYNSPIMKALLGNVNSNYIYCESKKYNKRIEFIFNENRKSRSNTKFKSHTYPTTNVDDVKVIRFISIANMKTLYYPRICPGISKVVFKDIIGAGTPIAKECDRKYESECIIKTSKGVTFIGSRIKFIIEDQAKDLIFYKNISADGKINFRYFCTNLNVKENYDAIRVTLNFENDPIFLNTKLQKENIDIIINETSIIYDSSYNTTISLNKFKDQYKSEWNINDKIFKGKQKLIGGTEYLNILNHQFKPNNVMNYVIGYSAIGKYTIVENEFNVNFYEPIKISYITASRNFTKSEIIGTDITLKCEITFDEKMNVMMYWKRMDKDVVLKTMSKKLCFGGVNNCKLDLSFQVLPIGKSAGEYRCIAMSLITNIQNYTKATSVYLSHSGIITEVLIQITPANNWWIFLLIALLLFILMIILCCCICLQRNKGQEYSVDEKERKNGNDPERELLESFFQDYQRPEEEPVKGSRASLTSSIKMGSEGSSMAEYGEIDPGKFNEDGSFINIYTDDKKNHTNV